MRLIAAIMAVALLMECVPALAQQQRPRATNYVLPIDVQPIGGGEAAKSNNYILDDTIGEANIGQSRTDNYSLDAGYRQANINGSISLSCDPTVNLGTITRSGTATGSGTCIVVTDADAGYQLNWQSGTNGTNGLVGYWPMDETAGTSAYDFSGFANTGTHQNTPTISSDVPSRYFSTRSLTFDGTNRSVKVPYNQIFDITGDISMAGWVKLTNAAGAILIKQSASTNNWDYAFYVHSSKLYLFSDTTFPTVTTSNSTIGTGWTHVAVVRSSGVTGFYINGVLDASASQTGNFGTRAYDLFAGSDQRDASVRLNGNLDDLRLYNRALRPEEIRDLASKSPAGSMVMSGSQIKHIDPFAFPATGGLVGHWRMDEPVSGTVADASNGMNDGTPNGASGTNNKPQPSNNIPASMTSRDFRSLNFDGTDDYVSVPNSSLWNLGANDFSLSFWVKLNSLGQQSLIGNYYGAGANGWIIQMIAASPGNFAFYKNNGAASLTSSSTLSTGTWYHIAAVRVSGTLTFYINGTSAGSASVGNIINSTSLLSISNATSPVNGSLDDVRIYNRALSATEVKALYGTPDTWAIASTATAFGARLRSSSTDADSKWGTDNSTDKWQSIGDGSYKVVSRSSRTAPAGSTEVLQFRAGIGAAAIVPNGSYSATVTVTALTL